MKHSSSFSWPCPDCARAVQRLPRNAGRMMIWIYRHTLSPLVGFNCRHLPTCSLYGDEAIERFGLWGGGWMTLARLLRCQPWGTSGIDNVPLARPAGARWYVPWRFGRFLDDAHQKTVLRQAGASYEFRHVILRDRLAARLEEDQ